MAYRNAFGIEKKREIEVVMCISEWAVGCQDANDEINDMKEPVHESLIKQINEWVSQRVNPWTNQWMREPINKWSNE